MSAPTSLPAVHGQIYLLDSDPSFLRSLGASLASQAHQVHVFASASAFLRAPLGGGPAVVLLDMMMPDMNGVQVQQQMRARGVDTPVVFVSRDSERIDRQIIQAFKQGAIDFLLKPVSPDVLLNVLERGLLLDAERRARVHRTLAVRDRHHTLTRREREVCRLMLEGYGNKEIAALNGSAPGTVKLHRSRVLEKMGTETLSGLMGLFRDIDWTRL